MKSLRVYVLCGFVIQDKDQNEQRQLNICWYSIVQLPFRCGADLPTSSAGLASHALQRCLNCGFCFVSLLPRCFDCQAPV